MFDLLPRLKEILNWTGLGPTVFADEIGVPRPVISHVFSGRNRVSLDVVQKILYRFPDLSSNWLLLGNGEMLKTLGNSEEGQSSLETPVKLSDHNLFENSEESKPKKVQNPNPGKIEVDDTYRVSHRRISRIVIFYSDGFFESFDQMPNL